MNARILVGDARERLAELPAASVDCVIADPPYDETALAWDQKVRGWLAPVRRVMKTSASLWCFGSLRFFMLNVEEFEGWKFVQDIVWEKHNGTNAQADRFRRVHELIAHFHPKDSPWAEIYKQPVFTHDAIAKAVRRKKRPPHWGAIDAGHYVSEDGGPRLMRSVFHARSCHGRAIHPTQKPTTILLPLIEYSCPPGGIVLDPFAGSGSVAIAASAIGRSSINIEINPVYAEMARSRIEADAPMLAQLEGER